MKLKRSYDTEESPAKFEWQKNKINKCWQTIAKHRRAWPSSLGQPKTAPEIDDKQIIIDYSIYWKEI